ncbi:hypothetical protein BH11PLA2_BH11PLA2_34000 [soil metagenome]
MTTTIEWVPVESLPCVSDASSQWLWDEYLASGMITLFTSRWKAGKTTLLSVLLSKLQGGTLAEQAVQAGSAYVLSEEPLTLWKSRNQLLNFPPSIRFSCRPFHGRPLPEEWLKLIVDLAAAPPALLILDPFSMFLPGHVENNAAALQDALEPLHRLTDRGTAILLVHHPRKSHNTSVLSPRGSGALTGFADILMELDRPHDAINDRVRRLRCQSRLRPSSVRTLELTEDGRDYRLLETPGDRESFDLGWPVLEQLLEDSDNPQTRKSLLTGWPEDYEKPSKNTLIRWLDEAARRRLIEIRGNGRKTNPYRYALKGQQFVLEDL